MSIGMEGEGESLGSCVSLWEEGRGHSLRLKGKGDIGEGFGEGLGEWKWLGEN